MFFAVFRVTYVESGTHSTRVTYVTLAFSLMIVNTTINEPGRKLKRPPIHRYNLIVSIPFAIAIVHTRPTNTHLISSRSLYAERLMPYLGMP